MNAPSDLDALVSRALYEYLAHHGGTQLLLFGPGGKPLWPARVPVQEKESHILRVALGGISRLAPDHARPFMSRHPNGEYVAAALDEREDLYFVLCADMPTQAAAEARVAAARTELAEAAARIRGQ